MSGVWGPLSGEWGSPFAHSCGDWPSSSCVLLGLVLGFFFWVGRLGGARHLARFDRSVWGGGDLFFNLGEAGHVNNTSTLVWF